MAGESGKRGNTFRRGKDGQVRKGEDHWGVSARQCV